MIQLLRGWFVVCVVIVWFGVVAAQAEAARLHVGTAVANITPDRPVALQGQRHTRIANDVESPCLAAVLALESRDGDRSIEETVFVACDLSQIPHPVRDAIHAQLKIRLPEFDVTKLILSATHTHTAPVLVDGVYDLPSEGVMKPPEYIEFMAERIAAAVVEARRRRVPAAVGWGLAHAVVARNRLAVYEGGKAQMYGPVSKPDFVRLEGYEDHGVEVMYFWDDSGKLIATAVNVACPAQEVENRTSVNADFWHPVREQLRNKYGDQLVVLGWTGTAGDQSPHVMLRKPAEERMLKLRKLTSLEAIAKRIVDAWEEAYEGAQLERHTEPTFAYHFETIQLPMRQVTQEEMLLAKKQAELFADRPSENWNRLWNQKVVDRYESQQPDETYQMDLRVLRIGDVAVATNDFELYTDYGVRMKARSPALQTFLIQLAGPGSYLPADRSIAGGAYGSVIQSGLVGPDGGQVLVDKTLEALYALWPKEK